MAPTATACSLKSVDRLIADLQRSSFSQRVSLPGNGPYQASIESYFSKQEQSLHPAAVVTPHSAEEVAEIVKTIAKYYHSEPAPCFAVRSGGKTPQAGSANVQAGVTIDLSAMNTVTIAKDRQTVKVGPGAKWGDVYPVTDKAGLGISGGRDATVGVGGLTLGGGISFFGPQRGFVCDDVTDFQVVLADGSIIEASKTSHPHLWKALKGGSNNFGIVTSFNFQSFDLGDLWGGQNVYPIETAAQHLEALYDFTANPNPDLHATVIQSFALYQGSVIVNEGLKYTKPIENPPVFKPFLAIEPCMHSTNKILNMTAAAIEQSGYNVNGRRQALMTTSFVNDRNMLQYAFDAWNTSVPSVQNLSNVQWSTTFQPLTPAITRRGQEFGGNVLGLDKAPPLILAQIAISWDDAKDDDFLIDKALGILGDIDETAKSRGLFNRYVYLNYAWASQDPIDGYGTVNKDFMEGVSKQYDPRGLFQTGLIGGFKLRRSSQC